MSTSGSNTSVMPVLQTAYRYGSGVVVAASLIAAFVYVSKQQDAWRPILIGVVLGMSTAAVAQLLYELNRKTS